MAAVYRVQLQRMQQFTFNSQGKLLARWDPHGDWCASVHRIVDAVRSWVPRTQSWAGHFHSQPHCGLHLLRRHGAHLLCAVSREQEWHPRPVDLLAEESPSITSMGGSHSICSPRYRSTSCFSSSPTATRDPRNGTTGHAGRH
eukprot:2486530-Prymnesium_polylepis.2